ncbi:MAG: hypothetical protein J5I94_06605 [Phaeodactylibacter sp.]|nr:hypothetical protein [Phaeodactylibacter sp.]
MPRFTALLIVLSVIGLIAFYVLEFRWFDRTLDMRSLALYAMGAGALLGTALARRFSRRSQNLVEKVQLYVFFIIFCSLFAPFFASLSNRLLSPHAPRSEPAEFFEQRAYIAGRFGLIKEEEIKPTGYYTFFYYEGQLRRVKSKLPLLPLDMKRGQSVELLMQKGLWGYDVVVHQGGATNNR